jgi:hypothetical protein
MLKFHDRTDYSLYLSLHLILQNIVFLEKFGDIIVELKNWQGDFCFYLLLREYTTVFQAENGCELEILGF